jgi:hypothetical protein
MARRASASVNALRHGGRQVDQRHRPADAQIWETALGAVGQPRLPGLESLRRTRGAEGVVVPGADGDVVGRAKGLQPLAGGGELLGRGKVDDVARYDHMVRRARRDVGRDGVEHGLEVPVLLAPPGEPAQQALGGGVTPAEGQGRRRKLQVRQVGEAEGGHELS